MKYESVGDCVQQADSGWMLRWLFSIKAKNIGPLKLYLFVFYKTYAKLQAVHHLSGYYLHLHCPQTMLLLFTERESGLDNALHWLCVLK